MYIHIYTFRYMRETKTYETHRHTHTHTHTHIYIYIYVCIYTALKVCIFFPFFKVFSKPLYIYYILCVHICKYFLLHKSICRNKKYTVYNMYIYIHIYGFQKDLHKTYFFLFFFVIYL